MPAYPYAYQEGLFEMFTGRVPNSVSGTTVYRTVDDGLYPLAAAGTFTFTTAASGNSYTSRGDGINTANSSGTYSYTVMNATTGRLQLNDSVGGADITYFAFSDAVQGRFAVSRPAGGFQVGHFTILDSNPPTLTIQSPASAARITTATLNIKGTASDDFGLQEVRYQINDSAWTIAAGTSNWNATVGLLPGPNVISAIATDTSGNDSAIVSASFEYVQMASLTVSVTGTGSVSPNLNGQSLQVGMAYKLTAKAGAGYVFSNWTGSVTSSTPTLTFAMQNGTSLQANFVPNPFSSVAGNYQGLFYDTGGIGNESSGFLSAVITTKGTFSAKLRLANLNTAVDQ